MATGNQGIPTRHLETLFRAGTVAGLTDAQLLDRYRTRRDEAAEQAFATLVERHGPMVLRVCRGILRDDHEAHDALQATFLVLVRRAGTLWVRDSLGPWLHQVAMRTATCSRSARLRRLRHEGRAASAFSPALSPPDAGREEVCEVIHEEVERLPHRYRAAVVLCLLEGLSTDQASRELGWPLGTVHSRLARGREQLRDRLARRGLLLPALVFSRGEPKLPSALVDATVRLTLSSPAGTVPAAVATLAGILLRSMIMTQIKVSAIALLMLCGLAAGAVVFASQDPPQVAPIGAENRDRSITLAFVSPYANVKTLEEAVQVARRPLEGKKASELGFPYDALLVLLSEKFVKEQIPIALKNYEPLLKRHPEPAESAEYFHKVALPKFKEIETNGVWPVGSEFECFFLAGPKEDDPATGMSLVLKLATPGEKFPSFNLPMIVINFADFGVKPSDDKP